jgi:arylsulfatase A-like enzyme
MEKFPGFDHKLLNLGHFPFGCIQNFTPKTFMKTVLHILPFLLISQFLLGGIKPNIVLVITDDQGYGDLGCTGNPIIQTPNIDKLANESIWLSDYHVAPTCSPTRAALQTGHWTNRTGVWHTIMGRSMLRDNEVTIGQMLKEAGYQTGMFGKWHLGDNYPYRPEDRGYTEVYRHGGGGVGQTPDVWDNSYFDGGYFHNSTIVPAKGFCTDVFFQQAHQFMEKCTKEKKPFFAYISTNAPHGPLHCPQKYLDLYKDQSKAIASFYGMITNIDDNVGQTRKFLQDIGVYENTIFIFTTDNGTASGAKIFNAGMRGQKGSEYDGGHRVPFFLHWPSAKMDSKKVIPNVCHAVDIAPTLLDLVAAKAPTSVKFDGVSLKPLMTPGNKVQWQDRFLVTDSQRVKDPIMWRKSSVMSQQYRLVNGTQLYDIQKDPGQMNDIAKSNPEQVTKMRAFYEQWWAELEPTFAQTTELHVGHPDHPEVSLTSHDWIQDALTPWNQGHIRNGAGDSKKGKSRKMVHSGHWALKVLEAGNYQVEVRRWPVEANKAINTELPSGQPVPGASKAFRENPGNPIHATHATLRLNGKDLETLEVSGNATHVSFTTKLTKGKHQLSPYFHIPQGELGCYYTVIRKLP